MSQFTNIVDNLSLFLGFYCDIEFEKSLKKIKPAIISHWTQGGDYLEEIAFEKKRFFGKRVPIFSTIEQLECLEINILSLLKQIIPNYRFTLSLQAIY